jgi:hypothetical protein
MDQKLNTKILDENFLEQIKSLKFEEKEEDEIFLQLIKADRIEAVSTKILSYIFDTHKNHGLGNLPLKALFTLLGIKGLVPKLSTTKEEVSCFYGRKVKKNGRMDLIIEASPYLFVIENKIRHKLDNPLEIYREWVEKNYSKNDDFTEKHYIVLGMNKPKEDLKNFKFVSHHNLVTKILEYKGEIPSAEPTHLTPFIEDYFRAMKNMNTSLSKEESQILDFCMNNFVKLDQLQDFKEKIANVFELNLINIVQEVEVFNGRDVYRDIADNWKDLGVYSDSQYLFVKEWACVLQIHYQLERIGLYLTPYSKTHKKVLSRDKFEDFLIYLKSLRIKFVEHDPINNEFYVEIAKFEPMGENSKIIKKINELISKIQ